MHLVRTPKGSEIDVIGLSQPFDTLMDEDVMDKEIGQAIEEDSQSNWPCVHRTCGSTEEEQEDTWNGEDEKEGIVPLQP